MRFNTDNMQAEHRTPQTFLQNLTDLPGAMAPSAIMAGLIATLVGYSGPLLVLFEAAKAGSLTDAQLGSWILTVTIGTGICAICLSLWYRQPIMCAFSSAGAVLMVTALAQFSYAEAVGGYLVAGMACALLGLSKLFGRAIALVPKPIVSALIAGVIFRFGIGLFTDFPKEPLLIGGMVLVFFLLKRQGMRAPSIGALLAGLALVAVQGRVLLTDFHPALAAPVFTAPAFSIQSMISIALPLFLLANTSQNAPGVAVLRNDGYDAPPDGPVTMTGLVTSLFALFGCHGITMSAITAAICTGKEAHPDPTKRYSAAVACGLWYALFGLFGATAVALFRAVPPALASGVAGLSLLGAVANGMTGAMSEPKQREGALVTFMLTVSGIELFKVGAPFWGLVAGVLVNALLTWRRRA